MCTGNGGGIGWVWLSGGGWDRGTVVVLRGGCAGVVDGVDG